MWTKISDDTGGGHSITGFSFLYMECSLDEMSRVFETWTGQNPDRSTPEYGTIISRSSFDSLQQASAPERGCGYDYENRVWTEAPGSWRPYTSFDLWLSQQRLDPLPESMLLQSQNWDADRHAQAAVARLPFLGALLLPFWTEDLKDQDDDYYTTHRDIDTLAETQNSAREGLLRWGESLESMAETAVWSPLGPGERERCLLDLTRASEALIDNAPANAAENNLGQELSGLRDGLQNGWATLFRSADESLAGKAPELAQLLMRARLPKALSACLSTYPRDLGEPGLLGVIQATETERWEEGRVAAQEALMAFQTQTPARAPYRRMV